MAFAPPLYVDTRTASRSRWGLIDAADEVLPEDGKFINGIWWYPDCLMNASVDARDCGDPAAFDLADGRPAVDAAPIHMYAGFVCRSVGMSEQEMGAAADKALQFSGPTALEAYLWSPPDTPAPDGPDQLRLMGPDTVILGGGTAVGFVAGVRLLEDYLATEYGRVGVIHAPAGTSADAGYTQQVRWENSKPVTQRGTRWSWGAYPYADPEGAAAAAGTAWMVATGAVTLRQTAARTVSDFALTLDRSTNEVFALATKSYVVTWECVTAAVLVNLTA